MEAAELAAFLDSGPAILGASAGEDLAPEAFRVWGASIDGDGVLRALASADAVRTFARVGPGTRLSFVLTDITNFRSVQAKGSALGRGELPGPADLALMRRYDERFTAALASIGHPPRLGQRLRPLSVFVLTAAVDQLYDQTPGPGAGAVLGAVGRA
jgi:hypothetical protein